MVIVTTSGSKPFCEQLLKQWRQDGCALPPALVRFVENTAVAPAHRLAAWLLWARNASSVWCLAARLLPEPSFTVPAATAEADSARAAYEATVVAADPALAVTPSDWLWALSCVHSRTFGADAWTRSERDGVLGICAPVADLLGLDLDAPSPSALPPLPPPPPPAAAAAADNPWGDETAYVPEVASEDAELGAPDAAAAAGDAAWLAAFQAAPFIASSPLTRGARCPAGSHHCM
jgi:hypothetical protein